MRQAISRFKSSESNMAFRPSSFSGEDAVIKEECDVEDGLSTIQDEEKKYTDEDGSYPQSSGATPSNKGTPVGIAAK